jgi:queuosine precursor transporter
LAEIPFLWLRNNGSTCISQMIDTLAIDTIFLYWEFKMEMQHVLTITIFSYAYKALFSVAITPLFYFSVFILQKE